MSAVDVQRLPITILGQTHPIASSCSTQLYILCSDTLQRTKVSAAFAAGHYFWLGICGLQESSISHCLARLVQYLHFWAGCIPCLGLVK